MAGFEDLGVNIASDIGSALVGKLFGSGKDQAYQAALNRETQYDFAKNSIMWKVNDAKQAGLHPLAVLGAAGAQYTPVALGDTGSTPDFSGTRQALRDMGQNTERAEAATDTAEARELRNLAVERARRENQLLDAQIAATWGSFLGQPGTPPMPSAGRIQGTPASSSGPYRSPAGLVKPKPSESVSSTPGDRGLEAAATPAWKTYDNSPNTSVQLPGQQMSESLESLGHFAAPALGVMAAARWGDRYYNGPGPAPDPRLEWDHWRQSYVPRDRYSRTLKNQSWKGSTSRRGSGGR